MRLPLRIALNRVNSQPGFIVHVPAGATGQASGACCLIWAARLHHEPIFNLPDGGFHQVNLAFVTHPVTQRPHAFIVASHEDHEGPWQEFISCDELLDCCTWDSFLDALYGYQLDSGLDLSVTNRDAFIELMPEWMDLLV